MAAPSKGVLVILDGLGDLPSERLLGRTPLEAAATPVLDGWASRGVCGIVDPLFPGAPVGTQTGCGALMGMALRDLERLARGPVEASGVGLDLEPGEVALHANFATLADDGVGILDRRAGRISEGTEELAAAIDGLELDGVTTRFRAATQHRAVLSLRGPALSPAVSDTDPGAGAASMRVVPCAPQVKGKAATRTAALINRWTAEAHRI
ncbi:MAG: alkaline phosphatase family protein, partial [Planctomycetota bacterium]